MILCHRDKVFFNVPLSLNKIKFAKVWPASKGGSFPDQAEAIYKNIGVQDMIFDNEQIEVSQYGYKALKSIIWSSRLHELIKTKRKSISKLSRECNLIKLVGDPESLRQRRKYAFLPRGKKMEVDLLKKFIFKNK